ncbi:MAG TPA: NifU family protein [Gemmatimonadaceae bacterium]|nr:NifU family protein [Gemmatimonadaceae bacterium]
MSLFKRTRRDDAAVEGRIRAAIVELASMLPIEAGGVELVEFEGETGVAVLRFEGDCPDCELSVSMLREGIEAHLRMHVPEIRAIRAV